MICSADKQERPHIEFLYFFQPKLLSDSIGWYAATSKNVRLNLFMRPIIEHVFGSNVIVLTDAKSVALFSR